MDFYDPVFYEYIPDLIFTYILTLFCSQPADIGYSPDITSQITGRAEAGVLCLYLAKRRGVQENTSMRSRDLLRLNAGIFLYSPTQVNVQTLSNI